MTVQTMTPVALKERLATGKPPYLLDVRTPDEFDLAHLNGAVLIPLGELQARVHEIPMDSEIVVICHHGIRSLHAAMWLENQGFSNIYNLSGGLDRWSLTVDPTTPRY